MYFLIKELASRLRLSGSWQASLQSSLHYPSWGVLIIESREELWIPWHGCVSSAMAACNGLSLASGNGPADVHCGKSRVLYN
jgi:hypothetical protein